MDEDIEFPCAVDIPIPRQGLGPMLTILLDATKACTDGARLSAYSAPANAEVRCWFNRIATRAPADAERLALTFSSLGARRVR